MKATVYLLLVSQTVLARPLARPITASSTDVAQPAPTAAANYDDLIRHSEEAAAGAGLLGFGALAGSNLGTYSEDDRLRNSAESWHQKEAFENEMIEPGRIGDTGYDPAQLEPELAKEREARKIRLEELDRADEKLKAAKLQAKNKAFSNDLLELMYLKDRNTLETDPEAVAEAKRLLESASDAIKRGATGTIGNPELELRNTISDNEALMKIADESGIFKAEEKKIHAEADAVDSHGTLESKDASAERKPDEINFEDISAKDLPPEEQRLLESLQPYAAKQQEVANKFLDQLGSGTEKKVLTEKKAQKVAADLEQQEIGPVGRINAGKELGGDVKRYEQGSPEFLLGELKALLG